MEVALDLLVPLPGRGDVVTHVGLVQMAAELAAGGRGRPQSDGGHAGFAAPAVPCVVNCKQVSGFRMTWLPGPVRQPSLDLTATIRNGLSRARFQARIWSQSLVARFWPPGPWPVAHSSHLEPTWPPLLALASVR